VLGIEVADRHVDPEPVVLAARLQQQHLHVRIGRETVGQAAAGRAGADDHIVERPGILPLVPLDHSHVRVCLSRLFAGVTIASSGAAGSIPRYRRRAAWQSEASGWIIKGESLMAERKDL